MDSREATPPPPAHAEQNESTRMLDIFQHTSAKGDDNFFVAPWLLQDLSSHKERIIKG